MAAAVEPRMATAMATAVVVFAGDVDSDPETTEVLTVSGGGEWEDDAQSIVGQSFGSSCDS